MKSTIKQILTVIAIILVIICLFYIVFNFVILGGVYIEGDKKITEYQFHHLQITFISACVTTLALIVALLKDEIKSLWSSANISIESKFPKILNEKKTNTQVVQAEYYYVALNICNLGSLPALQCSIILTELYFKNATGQETPLDISSAQEIPWTGKNLPQIAIHAGGTKSEVTILQIKPSDVSSSGVEQNTSAELFIGGLNISNLISTPTKKIDCKAIFVIYSQQTKPKKYILEITWDGSWHNRLQEMLEQSVKIKDYL